MVDPLQGGAHSPTRTAAATLTADFRRSLLRNLVLLVVVTTGAIMTVSIVSAYRTVKDLSGSMVERTGERVITELDRFFEPVVANLLAGRDWAVAGRLDLSRPEDLDEVFMPVLRARPQVSSMMVATAEGREYLLLRETDGWRTRLTDPARGARAEERYFDKTGRLVKREARELDYDARVRPWFDGAMAEEADDVVHWTDPYQFFTTKDPGITASIRWRTADGAVGVIAFDVLLGDLTQFTSSLKVSPGGLDAVISSDGRTLGFPPDPRFLDRAELKRSEAWLRPVKDLGIPALAAAVEAREKLADEDAFLFPFESEGEPWWAGVQPFRLPGSGPPTADDTLWSVVLVPEGDFLGDYHTRRNATIGIGIAALFAAIALAMITDRAVRRRVSRAVREATRLGQYVLDAKIGDGGMGSVYRAHHDMLRRPTAVKLLHPDRAASEDALKRFEREVQLTSSLTHPNTIAIYDYGRTPEGVFYYAMEYLVGASLQRLVEVTGPLPPVRIAHLLEQICGSLQEAHDAGLIHRDIKPANIMLCERGGRHDFVKVLDFGLVKEVGGEEDSQLTAPEVITGTPLYISPEALTASDTVDARSDLYAVGAVAYFLLTGKTVFEGESVMAVCAQQISEPPVPPSERTGKEYPPDLEQLVLRCLAKDPAERPVSAADVAAELAACAVPGHWGPPEAREWWTTNGDVLTHAEVDGDETAAAPGPASERPTLSIDLASRE